MNRLAARSRCLQRVFSTDQGSNGAAGEVIQESRIELDQINSVQEQDKPKGVVMHRTMLFVCPHGAGKSRMAAAFFNAVTPSDWSATTAGQDPADTVSPHAMRLLGGSDAEALLDLDPPRPLGAVVAPDRVVAIDCEVDGAERWLLAHQEFGEAMRDELRSRVEALAQTLHHDHR